VTGHPLTPFVPIIDKYALHKTNQLTALPSRAMTRIGGLVAEVQKGISKKSNKPYAMFTLEDLEGSVQVLCMNENFDKFRDLLVPNKALLITGEVNNSEDKPKIFPQEIMLLEDAPQKYTKQVHLRLHTAHINPKDLESLRELMTAHRGKCPLLLCLMQPDGSVVFIDTHERFSVNPSPAFQHAVNERFGEDTYYPKVDVTLPERAPRRWEKRAVENENKG
jgi:DNA polymerase-3 subunit alpha